MKHLIECVPNVSEGRNADTLHSLKEAACSVPSAYLLDVHIGEDVNRSVFTIAGEPSAVSEAVFRLARCACENIDMRKQRGSHPRMGAIDVVPFVPLQGASMEQCVSCAEEFGERMAVELGVPVFLYEQAARVSSRRALPKIRRGEFEGFEEKFREEYWRPDFGKARRHPSAGVTAVGARDFLIAYNVDLQTVDVEVAQQVAAEVRRRRRDGELPGVRAIGWYCEDRGCCQLSTNVTQWRRCGLKEVYGVCAEVCEGLGVEVGKEELVGLAPREALIGTGLAESCSLEFRLGNVAKGVGGRGGS